MDPTQALIDAAPIPTEKQLHRQRNLIYQFFRFMNLNIKMYLLAKKGH